jgi:hypothetical protein
VLVHGNRQTFFRLILTDHILVQESFDIGGLRQISSRGGTFRLLVVIDYLVTDINAFIANVNARSGDQFLYIVLRFAAKRTAKEFFRSAEICHRNDCRFLFAVKCAVAGALCESR